MSSKLNLLTFINIYDDKNVTNTPAQNSVKWTFDKKGLDIGEPWSKLLNLQPSEEFSVVNEKATLLDDGTSVYDLGLKAGTTNTYIVSNTGGSQPNFRIPRAIVSGAADTEITVTKNGPLLKFENTAGTATDFSTIQSGDVIRIKDLFETSNLGVFEVVSSTASYFTVKNILGIAEVVVLGASFADIFESYSSSGVQIGERLDISEDFSSLNIGDYEITDVGANYIEFYSGSGLVEEQAVSTTISIYKKEYNFLYIESDKNLEVLINGESASLSTLKCGTSQAKGILLKTGDYYQLSIINKTESAAKVFVVVAE